MSGGIAQLVAIGAQDVHIVGKPEVSFFRSNYKRHTNFAQTVERQVIQGNPAANGMSTVRFERKGDLLGYVFLAPNDGTQATENSVSDLLSKISKVELLIGGQVIDEQTSHFSQHIAPTILAQNLTKSTTGFANKRTRFYPLRFSFCEHVQSMLPLIALQYHDVEIRITWGSTTPGTWECYAQYVYLDNTEREAMAAMPHNMLITQTQRAIASQTKIQELNFNHPIKVLAASGAGSDLSIANNDNKVKLQINGVDVTDFKYVDPHYTAVSAYYHTASAKDETDDGDNKQLFLYPFCLETCKYQPTGSLNFSRIDSARLVSDTRNNTADVYAVNYNVLRIENGMGGLMYSN